jgi:hypothetical protein
MWITGGNAAAESRARHYAARTFGSACSIAIAGSGGHVESSRLRNVDGPRLRGFRRHAVRIAEAARLHFSGARSMVCGAELPVEKRFVVRVPWE